MVVDATVAPIYTGGMETDEPKMAPGRPRGFCTDAALAAALRVFRAKGYEGASLSDLTGAMGINRPSLYAAFGNKEALFRKALDLYQRKNFAFMAGAIAMPTARGVAERIFEGALAVYTASGEPSGCLFAIHSVACGEAAEPARREIVARRAAFEEALADRFARAHAEDDLAEGIAPIELAQFLTSILQGMAVRAGSGATRDELERLATFALRLWPSR